MAMPTISVIVPVYNAEKYLSSCLDSLTQQTFQDIEIICVNDGSMDSSLDILNQYAAKDRRIKVYTQENQGVAVARNTAIQYATGAWLAFCDSDDTVPLHAYQALYNASKNVDIVVGEYYEIDDLGSVQLVDKKGKFKNNLFYAVFQMPTVWNKLIRASFVKENELFFKKQLVGEDFIFLAECISKKPAYNVVNQPVYYYWNHTTTNQHSLTHKYDYAHFEGHIYCRQELMRICWEDQGITEAYEYLYRDALTYPFDYLFRMQDFPEKEQAFYLFRSYIQQFDWSEEYARFECMMGMPYQKFMQVTARTFFTETYLLDPAENVLKRYEAGMLGFRYIIKYMKAWLKYKLK